MSQELEIQSGRVEKVCEVCAKPFRVIPSRRFKARFCSNPCQREKVSQAEQVLAHLESGRSLTALDSLRLMGIMRLAARIKDLRRQGYDIRTEIEEKNGKKFAKYSLNPVIREGAAAPDHYTVQGALWAS